MMYCTCMALWLFWVLNRNDTNFKLSIFDFFYDRNLKRNCYLKIISILICFPSISLFPISFSPTRLNKSHFYEVSVRSVITKTGHLPPA